MDDAAQRLESRITAVYHSVRRQDAQGLIPAPFTQNSVYPPAVAEMFDLYRQFYEQKPDLPLAKQFIADRLSNHESVILVAESASSGMLGFCQLYPSFCSVEAKPIYSLYDLYVLPVARKSGVGRMLLIAAESKAAAEGKARMDLTTARTNKAAQSLYESLSWVRDEIFFAYNRRVPQS